MAVKKPFIGQMDRKITISEKTSVRNETGEAEPGETVICEPWACKSDESGSEDIEGKVRPIVDRTYTIHFRKIITEKKANLLVTDGADKFEVYHVREIGRRDKLQLLCRFHE